MADVKISQLPAATTPVAGTEVLPIVQSGSTVKVSVENLTLGRAVNSAGGTITDNIIQGTAAKGINFSANTPAAGKTTQVLAYYEEGTFTPTFTNLTVVGTPTYTGTYVRQGRMVYINLRIQSTTSTSSTSGSTFANGGFPFISANIYTNVSAINTGTFATFANGGVFGLSGGNTILYTPTWTAAADVTITGFYFV